MKRPRNLRCQFLAIVCCLIPWQYGFCSHLRSGRSSKSSTLAGRPRWMEFPSYLDTLEMARLSHLVYHFRRYDSCNATDSDGTPLLPTDLDCHLYDHSLTQGTQVLVLTSKAHEYVAVVYAGTDDLRTTLTDGDILMKPFGPLDENGDSILLPGPARVHAGFDNAVFEGNLFDTLLSLVKDLHSVHKRYRIFTTGHSLGGADSILTAVALAHHFPNLPITSLSFGCPRTGNRHWRDAVHEMYDNLSIWRFVHGWDLVPRLPEFPFEHVGHTVQMNPLAMNAYYFHYGNASLGYAGVPFGWSSKVWIWVPGALWSHHIAKYESYLRNQSKTDPETFFIQDFVMLPSHNDTELMDDDNWDDDYYVNPRDDWFERDVVDGERDEATDMLSWLKAVLWYR